MRMVWPLHAPCGRQFHSAPIVRNNDGRRHLERLANFGATVSKLEELVPALLQKSLPHEMLSNSVCLKFYFGQTRDMNYSDEHQLFGYTEGQSDEDFVREVSKRQRQREQEEDDSGPIRFSLPHARGKPAYSTCWKVIQFLASAYVRSDTQLQITKMTLHPPHNDSDSARVIIKWCTVDTDTDRWGGGGGGGGLGAAFSYSELEAALAPVPVDVKARGPRGMHDIHDTHTRIAPTTPPNYPFAWPRVGFSFGKLFESPAPSEHILSGIFIFDLNENCDLIQTHIVDNVDVIKEKEQRDVFKLA